MSRSKQSKNRVEKGFGFLDGVKNYVARNRRKKWRDFEKSEHEVEPIPKKKREKIIHSFPHLLNKEYLVPEYKLREFFTTERPGLPGNFEKLR